MTEGPAATGAGGVVRLPPRRPRRAITVGVVVVFVGYLAWLAVSDRARIDSALLRFQGAVMRNYDKLAEELRADLPLKRIWALADE